MGPESPSDVSEESTAVRSLHRTLVVLRKELEEKNKTIDILKREKEKGGKEAEVLANGAPTRPSQRMLFEERPAPKSFEDMFEPCKMEEVESSSEENADEILTYEDLQRRQEEQQGGTS